jgi:protein-disulfide isomerase
MRRASGGSRVDTILTIVLVICALITVTVLIRRELVPKTVARSEEQPIFIEDWRAHLTKGTLLGSSQAPVQLIEFADFECPFCSVFYQDLRSLQEKYPAQIALTYIHFPLLMHRFAEPAARAAECAGRQGRFEPMMDQLFRQQKAMGLKSWTEFASEAGVPQVAAFDVCMQSDEPEPRIVEGRTLGEKLMVRGTPTLIVNGWKLGRPPKLGELEQMVKAILAGKSPFPAE